jgi:hypothetical protein
MSPEARFRSEEALYDTEEQEVHGEPQRENQESISCAGPSAGVMAVWWLLAVNNLCRNHDSWHESTSLTTDVVGVALTSRDNVDTTRRRLMMVCILVLSCPFKLYHRDNRNLKAERSTHERYL